MTWKDYIQRKVQGQSIVTREKWEDGWNDPI